MPYYVVKEGTWDPDLVEEPTGNFVGIRTVFEFENQGKFLASQEKNASTDKLIYDGENKDWAHVLADQISVDAGVRFALWQAISQPGLRMYYLKKQIGAASRVGRVADFLLVLEIYWDHSWGNFASASRELKLYASLFSKLGR